MNLTKEKINNYSVLNIEGRIDTINSAAFEAEIERIYSSGEKDIILNCRGMKYISSSGLRIFLIAQKKATALKGKLHLCDMQPSIREIFVISGFSTLFRIFDTQAEAMEE